MRKLQILAARCLSPSIFNRVLFKTMYLLKQNKPSDDLKEFSPFISQTLNFFIVSPMNNPTEARQQIEMVLTDGKVFDNEVYKVFHEETFEPAELIAGVALLFRQIFHLHFTQRGFIEDADFQAEVVRVVMNCHELILEVFPDISKQLDYFLIYFEKKYLSPWNPARYSDRKSRANFGTGVDYIMK